MVVIPTINRVRFGLTLILLGMLLMPYVFAQLPHANFVPVAPESLPNAFVRCIYKDSRGFMWFGTVGGLMRYDGTTIYKYEHNSDDANSITDNRINSIFEDLNQNLWIGTAQGLIRYDREHDDFINVDSIPGNINHLNNRFITSLCADRKGRIWIGTHGQGVTVYDPKKFTFIYLGELHAVSQPQPASNYITSLCIKDDFVWAGTKAGLKLFNTLEMNPSPLPFTDKSIADKEITQVIYDRAENMWLATLDKEIIKLTPGRDGTYEIHKTTLARNPNGEGGDNILTLCLDAADNLWIGGENSGLNYLDTKSNKVVHYEGEEGNAKKLPTNSVRAVYVDNGGITWIGTHNKGAYLIDSHAKKFDSYRRSIFTQKGLTGNNVKGLAEDSDGNIWLAYYGGGLGKLNVVTNELQFDDRINTRLATRYLSALLHDAEGNLWIGTWGQGLYKWNLHTGALKNYKLVSNGFGDNKILSLYQDNKKRVWVGSVGSGLFYVDEKTDRCISFADEQKANGIRKTAYVTSILEDENGELWVGTLFGLYRLTVGDGKLFDFAWYVKMNEPGNIGSTDIQTIYEDAEKNVWFGTGDNGIAMLLRQNSTFRIIQKRDGLLSNAIRSILTDAKGNMWIGSNMGLSKYVPGTNSIQNFIKDDGLPSNEFNANACLQARDGKFYFGSYDGLFSFYPDSIKSNTAKPVVHLTDLKLNNQSVPIDSARGSLLTRHISLTSEIELPYSQRSFVIDFVAINYGQTSRNKYCYKLEGFDHDWNCVGSNRSATYTNLDPGHYVFFVTASNSDGISSEKPARLEITIPPAPWKTWWAVLLYLLLMTALVYFAIKIRLERMRIKSQLEFERLAREKEHALMESKTQFFTNVSHEFRTPLSLISMPLESLLSADDLPANVKERLGTIQASTDKMMRLVNELMDFNKLEHSQLKLQIQQGELVKFITDIASAFNGLAQKKNVHFGIHSMVRSLNGWFDHDKLEKILVNVLSNAFKFTAENGQINIVINAREYSLNNNTIKSQGLELVIIDNGIGISVEELPYIFDKFYQASSSAKITNPGTGIGLSLTKGLVELHHGSINAESTPDHETRFVITLPIDRHAYTDDDISEIQTPVAASAISIQKEYGDDSLADDHAAGLEEDKAQILVVEDNDELRKYIADELRKQFNVIEARNGQEGLEIAFEKTPDLIVSDILMPVKNGIELCREIKGDLKTSHIPFILLTAKTTVDDQVTGITTGADVYITKPFSIRFLVAQVHQIVASRQKLYSRFSQDVYLIPSKVASNEIDQAFLQKAIDYIVEHLQDPQLGVDSIADLFNLSRMQVYRKIKALTGNSVVDFIRVIRVKQALKLMEMHKFTLSEIAYKTGFNSASYFTRCFKELYGKAPSEYLESN